MLILQALGCGSRGPQLKLHNPATALCAWIGAERRPECETRCDPFLHLR
jgi:hypothetical protein